MNPEDAEKIMALLERGWAIKLKNRDGDTFGARYSVWQIVDKVVFIDENGKPIALQG